VDRPIIRVMPPRPLVAGTPEERAAVHHLRGDCHDSGVCPVCQAYVSGRREALRQIAEG
jgi:hypothetical protein